MSGYKRVNFYELCRLCATNQQKEKTHIFQEEGRKIQLQNKIQSCLSLKVCENDFLPKVVCSQCLLTLEECSTFRKDCFTSETMLSSYFNNFRYTDDFKKSGKVYIKDMSPKIIATEIQPPPPPITSTITNPTNNASYNLTNTQENVPYYTLHLPSLVQQQEKPKEPKTQLVYNFKTTAIKTNATEVINNVTVNSNGEIITLAPLVDVDTLFGQSILQKTQKKHSRRNKIVDKTLNDSNMIKIDLTQNELETKRDSAIKVHNKIAYTLKLDESAKNSSYMVNSLESLHKSNNFNQSLVLNQTTRPRLPKNYSNLFCGSVNVAEGVSLSQEASASLNQGFNPMQQYNSIIGSSSKQDCIIPLENVATEAISMFSPSSCNNQVLRSVNNLNFNQPQQNICASNNNDNQTSAIISDLDNPVSSKLEETKQHACDVCSKTFKRREHLYQHVKLHSGFRPFKCENCNKSFMRKEHLLRHITSHSGQKNYTCDVCDKSFSRNDNLLKHKKIHNKQNSFTCETCQKQFVMEHYYVAHKHTHDIDKCNANQVWGLLKAV